MHPSAFVDPANCMRASATNVKKCRRPSFIHPTLPSARQSAVCAALLLSTLALATSASRRRACVSTVVRQCGRSGSWLASTRWHHDGLLSDTPLDTGPDKTACWWNTDGNTSVTLSRQTNAFGPGGAVTPAELAQSLFPVPDEARTEVDALNQAGVSDVHVPNYTLTAASGIGDAALWVFQKDPSINVASGGFVVDRGADAIVFGIAGPDEPEAKSQATAFANAVLTTLAP
jgi:hypothetical protein